MILNEIRLADKPTAKRMNRTQVSVWNPKEQWHQILFTAPTELMVSSDSFDLLSAPNSVFFFSPSRQ